MNSFDQALKAFQLSNISFDQLLQIARQTGQASESIVAEAKRCLDSEFRAGQISPQIYAVLDAELSDKTQIAPPTPHTTDIPSRAPIIEEATVLQEPRTATEPPTVIQAPRAATEPPTVIQGPRATSEPSTVMDTESLLNGLQESHPYQELTVGSTLKNRFVLQQLLGVGGMGMVFKATDLRKIEAQDKEPYVALKVLNQDFQANPMALVSLQRETKRAQTLSHPNIIKVYDFDRDGGHVFMSMEYLQGKPLSHLIKEYPEGMPFKQAWPLIHAMADALRHAHKKNIVHSDFKPGNVLIDESGEVRVLDFGIACAIGRGDKDHQDATVFNARSLGAYTPAYASLEQLQNSDPDPRDDIYALACVSYELLTGKHPFGRLSAEKAQEVNLQAKPIAKLSRRQFKGLQNALAFEQAKRTKTIDAFLSALGPRSTVFYGLWGTGIFAFGLFAANIYLSMIAPPKVMETPKVNVQLSPEQQQKIKDLLELASIHADVGYLTAPTGSNALWAYREVLKIDPYNKAATNGIIGIADTLEQQAWEAYERNDRSTALKKVQDGLEAYPTHKGLLSLQAKLRSNP